MSFFKSALVVSFFTLLSRILGFVRDVFIAKYLGTGFFADVFFGVFRFPNFFRRIFAEGALNSAFVPIFSGTLAVGDRKDSARFAVNIFSIMLIILLIFTLLIEIFMPTALHAFLPGFVHDAEKFQLSVKLARITFPYLLLISLMSIGSGILNSLNKFAVVSATPILLNFIFIVALVFFNDFFPNPAYTLSYAVLFAGLMQFLWVYLEVTKHGIILYPKKPRLDNKTREFFTKFLPGIIGASVAQINVLVDVIIATLIPGAVSYLYYADRIVQFPMALIGTAIGVAILPTLSREVQTGQFDEANKTQNLAFEISMFLILPVAILVFVFAREITTLLFERGMFIRDDAIKVARAIMVYAVALPAFVLAKIVTPTFFARKDTKTPMHIAIVCLIINLSANLILMRFIGYLGIALATTISSWTNVLLLLYIGIKRGDIVITQVLKINTLKIAYNCIFITILIVALKDSMFNRFVEVNNKAILLYLLSIATFVSGAVYLSTAYLTDLIDIQKIKLFFIRDNK